MKDAYLFRGSISSHIGAYGELKSYVSPKRIEAPIDVGGVV